MVINNPITQSAVNVLHLLLEIIVCFIITQINTYQSIIGRLNVQLRLLKVMKNYDRIKIGTQFVACRSATYSNYRNFEYVCLLVKLIRQ